MMTEEEKQTLRKSFAGKKVSEMNSKERELFDKEFHYGFSDNPNLKPVSKRSKPLPKPKDLTMAFLYRMNLVTKK